MYLPNKYLKIYFSLIEKRKKEPYIGNVREIHHIIPKCFGGGNSHENLVHFSAREHYIAHKLLIRITEGFNRERMIHALWGMSNRIKNNSSHLYMTSRNYENARKLFLEIAGNSTRGKTYEEIYGKEKAKELKKLRGESTRKSRKGKTWEEIFGKENVELRKKQVSNGAKKRIGQTRTKETREKIRNSRLGMCYPKIICPECSRHISVNNIKSHTKTHQK